MLGMMEKAGTGMDRNDILESVKETITNVRKETSILKDTMENKFEELKLDLDREELRKVQRNEIERVDDKVKNLEIDFRDRLELKMELNRNEFDGKMKSGFDGLLDHQRLISDQIFEKVKCSLDVFMSGPTDSVRSARGVGCDTFGKEDPNLGGVMSSSRKTKNGKSKPNSIGRRYFFPTHPKKSVKSRAATLDVQGKPKF